jgi:ribonuclease VapC
MFIDTSVIVAIMLGEPVADDLSDRIEDAEERFTGGHCKLEACMVLSSRKTKKAADVLQAVNFFLAENEIRVLDFSNEMSEAAIAAFDQYGKGRNPKTALNLADCMSYAFAKTHDLKILYTGKDFQGTDLKAA